MATIKRCRSAFTVWVDGAPRVVSGGDLVDADDPVIRGREELFEDVETFMSRTSRVEQATSGPGEKRDLPPPPRTPGRGGRRGDKGPSGEA